jgi:hypothetical protein
VEPTWKIPPTGAVDLRDVVTNILFDVLRSYLLGTDATAKFLADWPALRQGLTALRHSTPASVSLATLAENTLA